MMLPVWASILMSLLNVLLSNGAIAALTYAQTGDSRAAAVAGLGSLVNHLRTNPMNLITSAQEASK